MVGAFCQKINRCEDSCRMTYYTRGSGWDTNVDPVIQEGGLLVILIFGVDRAHSVDCRGRGPGYLPIAREISCKLLITSLPSIVVSLLPSGLPYCVGDAWNH